MFTYYLLYLLFNSHFPHDFCLFVVLMCRKIFLSLESLGINTVEHSDHPSLIFKFKIIGIVWFYSFISGSRKIFFVGFYKVVWLSLSSCIVFFSKIQYLL